jgi:hypothetical protein
MAKVHFVIPDLNNEGIVPQFAVLLQRECASVYIGTKGSGRPAGLDIHSLLGFQKN